MLLNVNISPKDNGLNRCLCDQIFKNAVSLKARLCMNLRKLPFYLDENADIFFPRCYLVSDVTEECRLRNDFRLTSAICILKWVIYNSSSDLSSPSTGEGQMEKDYTEGSKEALVTGIKCVDRLDEFLKLKEFDPSLENPKWVVQKYIEKPLLIYDTKFDIRISVHLCNNAIQKRLKPSVERNPLVPKESMWSSGQFQEYLKIKGRTNIWQGIVYPSMKKAIICSLVTVQTTIQARKNNFGLYGADFLLGEDFKPWLIEINLSPSMSRSTSVTALLCANVQEDTIKVIIDRKYNSKCNIGQFERMSKQERKYLSRSVDSLQAKAMYKDK
ncbi:hypothetical protein scyTo_0010508 [Scyliorhinus torazame]|uniref:ATP-grasp domain-containing protein n=1 Tax=Scyliorhinus torazame TaxID=75743 RepID=A0A401P7S6_SCYTO|nr:hypothetical protein [Scyliorhinus torazame]